MGMTIFDSDDVIKTRNVNKQVWVSNLVVEMKPRKWNYINQFLELWNSCTILYWNLCATKQEKWLCVTILYWNLCPTKQESQFPLSRPILFLCNSILCNSILCTKRTLSYLHSYTRRDMGHKAMGQVLSLLTRPGKN